MNSLRNYARVAIVRVGCHGLRNTVEIQISFKISIFGIGAVTEIVTLTMQSVLHTNLIAMSRKKESFHAALGLFC